MAHHSYKLADPAGDYTGGYTSNVSKTNRRPSSDNVSGVIQVSITSGTVSLEGRLVEEAPWIEIKSYSASTIEEIVLPTYLRVIASGNAEVWVSEVT